MIEVVDEKTILFTRSLYRGSELGFSALNINGDCVINYHHCREVLCGTLARHHQGAAAEARYKAVAPASYAIHIFRDTTENPIDRISSALKVLHSFEDEFGIERTAIRKVNKDSLFIPSTEDFNAETGVPTGSRVGAPYKYADTYHIFKVKVGEHWDYAMPMLSLHLLIFRAAYKCGSKKITSYRKLLGGRERTVDLITLKALDKKLPVLFNNLGAIYSGVSEKDRWNQVSYRLGIQGIERLFNFEIPGVFSERLKKLLEEK